jgi:hypothetical protein
MKTLIMLFQLGSVITTFASPTLSDGIYGVTTYPDGTREHIKLAELSDTVATGPPDRIAPRSVTWPSDTTITCDNNNYLWHDNLWNNGQYNGAYNFLWDFAAGNHRPSLGAALYSYYYASVGSALAYFCAYGPGSGTSYHHPPLVQEELLEAFEWIASVCTQGTDGWAEAGMFLKLVLLTLLLFANYWLQ